MLKRGGWVISPWRPFPTLFDLMETIAGSFRYPLRRLLLLCWAGKTITGLMVAFAGAWGLSLIMRWVELIGL